MSARALWLVTATVSLACSGSSGDDFFKAGDTDMQTTASTTTGGLVDVSGSSSTSTTGSTSSAGGGSSSTSGTTTTGSSAQTTGGASSNTGTGGNGSGGNAATGGGAGNGGAPGSGGSNAGSGGSGASGGDANTATGGTSNAGSGGTSNTASGGTANGGSGGSDCTPTDEICDGLDNDCNGDIDDGGACPDACTGASFGGHAYVFCVRPGGSNATRDWEWAMNFCLDRGQVLVRVDTAEENAFLYEQLNEMAGSGSAWMAATDQQREDVWVWANGGNSDSWQQFYDGNDQEPVDGSFVDWSPGEPDNTPGINGGADCGAFEDLGDGEWGWADRPCTAEYNRVICEDAD